MNELYITPEFEVVRNENRCIACRVCERQCANEVHSFDETRGVLRSDEIRCVNCQRCVSLCPTHALKIVKNNCTLRENANWQNATIKEIYKQANTGGVLLSSMGNPKPMPVYWDKILINASRLSRQKAGRAAARRRRKAADGSGAAAFAFHAGDVFRHELRLHQLQRARVACRGGRSTRNLV